MEKEKDIFQQIGEFLSGNPLYSGLFFSGIGVFIILVSICDANWVFGGAKTFNLDKVEGWVNFFGRKTARCIFGVCGLFVVFFGIFWAKYR